MDPLICTMPPLQACHKDKASLDTESETSSEEDVDSGSEPKPVPGGGNDRVVLMSEHQRLSEEN